MTEYSLPDPQNNIDCSHIIYLKLFVNEHGRALHSGQNMAMLAELLTGIRPLTTGVNSRVPEPKKRQNHGGLLTYKLSLKSRPL